MKKFTVQDIMDLNPCYSREKISALGSEMTLVEICNLNIAAQDIIWVVCRLIHVDAARQFAVDCAEQVAHFSDDVRVKDCIETIKRYLTGESTLDELKSAADAAYAAGAAAYAAYAAGDAAAYAAYAAADAAAYAAHAAGAAYAAHAANVAANVAAATYAAGAAAYAAERKWQVERLKELVNAAS
jgi:hypothetical protein